MSPDEKKEKIAAHFKEILNILGLCSLTKTPERVAGMYVDEIFSGLDKQNYPEITLHQEQVAGELVLIKNCALVSFCEHHLVPMTGVAHVAYLPKNGVLGFTKIHRIIRHFAKRPQLQERLTRQIAENLQHVLQTEDVAVALEMKHFCVIACGGEDFASEAETHLLKGRFENEALLRSEFFMSIQKEKIGREGKPDSVPTLLV